MADLVVIVPTRGRPQAAAELLEAFRETRTVAHLAFAIDEDDHARDAYIEVLGVEISNTIDTGGAPSTMVRALNASAVDKAVSDNPPFAIGFMGDDHRPRTVGWDKEYIDALRDLGTGIVYGNDLLQGEALPTQCAMTADIVRTLGYMAPPSLRHMYVDNFWRDLGREAGCIRYLPGAIVEHMHPIVGKAAWDEGHRRVNDQAVYDADQLAYGEYHTSGRFAADVAKVHALLAVAVA